MLGVDIVLLTELTRRIGNQVLPLGAPWGADVVHIGNIALPEGRVLAAGVAVVVFAGLWFLFARTRLGIGMRAAAADGPTASLMGIRLSRTGATGWALAGLLAALAGIFLTSFPAPGVSPTVALSAFLAIPAWVLGGFDSVPGAVLGGLIIGLVTSLTVGYESDLAFLGSGFGEVVPYLVMIIVLLVRPQGLLAARRPSVSDLPRRIGLAVLLLGRARAAPGPRELLAPTGAVRDGRRHRCRRSDPAGRRRRSAVPRARGVRGHRGLRLRLGHVGLHPDARRRRPAPRGRARARRRGRGPRRLRVLARREPAPWRLPRAGHPRPGVPGAAPSAQPRPVDGGLHRALGGAVHGRRLQLQQQEPRLPRHRGRGVPGAAPALVPVPRPHAAGRLAGRRNLRTSRTGRAWANLRDSETAAAAMGIAVARHKASAFVVSSGYAGLAGALLALAYGRLSPTFQPHTVGRLPGHDRAGRARLRGRGRPRRAVRHGPAAGAGAVQQFAAVPGRAGLRGTRPRDAVPAAVRRGDHPRPALPPRRHRRSRPPSP